MKKFVLQICYFLVALGVILLITDIIISYKYHQKLTRKYVVWNDIVLKNLEADLIIMGNSRAKCQYDPYILDSILHINSYNLGMDGSAFNRQKARYDIYRHYQKVKPSYIIQNIEYFTLGHTIGYEREQFMPFMMYPYFRKRICEEESFSFGELYIPMYRYYMNNVYDDYFKTDDVLYKGYFGEDVEWNGDNLAKVKPYKELVDSTVKQMFIDYIIQTKEDSIQMVLVFAPIYKDVSIVVQNSQEISNLFRSISEQYDVPLLDYSNSCISQDTTYFFNAFHLNKRGTELFTTQLAHDLDSLGIIPTANSR
jgi:hypothetical protein